MTDHHPECEDATGAYPGSCTCAAIKRREAMEHVIHSSMPIDFERRYAMDNLIAQDADLIEICPDDLMQRLKGHSEIMERDKGKVVRFIDVATCTEAADLIEAQAAEIERLREHLISALDTLKDAQVCNDECGPCNEAYAALEARGLEIREISK